MSLLLGFVAVVVAWAVLLRTVLFGCTAALPGVVARFTAVIAVAGGAGLLVLTACALRCLDEGAVFRLKIPVLSALWSMSRLPLAAIVIVVSRLLSLLVVTTDVLSISIADATRVYRISSCSRRRRVVFSHASRCFSKPCVLSCFSQCLG